MNQAWPTKRLADVCQILGGATPSKKNPKFYGGDIPWATVGDMNVEVITTTEEYITKAAVADCSTNVIPSGSIVMATRVGLGKVCVLGQDTAINQDLKGLTPKNTKELTTRWLFWWLKSKASDIQKAGTGATVQGVKMTFVQELEIPLPTLAEQKRIVALLDEAFAGIDTLSSNAKTRSSEALCVFEQERDSFFANPDNKYTETTVSDITTRLQYGTSEKSASTGRYVVLRMGNIQDGEIDYEDLKYTSSQEVIDQYALKPGDVLFNRTNSPQWVGKSAIYRGEMPAVFAGYNIKIHTIADKIDSEFLTFFLNSDRAMSFGRSTFISSVNQANINAEKLRSYRLPLPPLREQKAIADRLGQIRKMSRALAAIYQNSLAQSEHLKAAILRSAFNGTL